LAQVYRPVSALLCVCELATALVLLIVMAPKAKPKAAADPKAKAQAKAKAPAKEKKEKEEDQMPKMDPPDQDAFNEKIQNIQTEIDKLQTQQSAITAKINERSGGKEDFFQKKAEIRAELDAVSARMDEIQGKKEGIQKTIGDSQQQAKDMRKELNSMKKSIGFTSEAEIDERIASIEFKLWTESIPLKEEKKLLAEIQDLKKSKPKVLQMNQMEGKLTGSEAAAPLKEQNKALNESLAGLRDQKREIQARLAEITEARKAQLGDTPQLIEERETIGGKIREKIQERNQARDEFGEAKREFAKWQAEQRRVRSEKIQAEREKRQAEWDMQRREREVEKLDEQPYISEITLIEQTIKFCKSLLPKGETEQKEEKSEVVYDNPEGSQVLIKKSDRDEWYFTPTKKGKGAKTKGKDAKGDSGASSKPIKHNAETFRLFDQLKIDAPITTGDIPAALAKLEEEMASYQEKIKQWEETREETKRKIRSGVHDDEKKDKPTADEDEEEKEKEELEEEKEEAKGKEEEEAKEEQKAKDEDEADE